MPEPSRQRSSAAPKASLSGIVERVTFHNAENGFCVLRVRSSDHREVVTVVASAASVSAGERLQAAGEWIEDAQHGRQFKAQSLELSAPSTREGIERYLGSGMIPGIGKELAKRLVKAFGKDVFDVIDSHPERLRTVEGIGPKRVSQILQGWAEQRAVRDIMVFLQSHGVGTSRAVRIYRQYGADSVKLITENPYRLANDIRGIGFRTADEIAGKLGIAKDAPMRAEAGLAFTLLEATGSGHCALPEDELLDTAREKLGIPHEVLIEALASQLDAGQVTRSDLDGLTAIFLTQLYQAERSVAERLLTLATGHPPWGELDVEAALGWVAGRSSIELAPTQRAAVQLVLGAKVSVLTGGPGVGKTTLVNAILDILSVKKVRGKPLRLQLCAPTGRAAKRLSESTGRTAKTIHRLLEPKGRGGFTRGADAPLDCDVLVVDETSMVDTQLMSSLLDAVPRSAALLLVGDVDQLPSVGPGQVLRDVIDSKSVPVARLTEIFRQAQTSRIVTNAHRVNEGRLPELEQDGGDELSDFYFIEAADAEDAVRKIVQMVGSRIPGRFGLDRVRDIQLLCPMNRGTLGSRALNLELQKSLNPPQPGQPAVERFGWTFRRGDKVMQIENDYDKDVFNGDSGIVSAIDRENQELTVSFDGRPIAYRFADLDQLVLAYAITIHKSQGSEYPAVLVPVSMQQFVMLQKNLFYTAITRGKKLVILIGEKRALAMAVRNQDATRRYTRLRQWLREGVG
ncbi:MAG: ATP-dependent RecD-like DNA helicase [Acidobacteriota bacterium]